MSNHRIAIAGPAEVVTASDGRVTVTLPIQIRRRAAPGRVIAPTGDGVSASRPADLTALQRALVRGHRWLAMIECGEAQSLRDIAARESVDNSYVSRMINLTTLAPDIVAGILDDALSAHLSLFELAVNPSPLWSEQRTLLA